MLRAAKPSSWINESQVDVVDDELIDVVETEQQNPSSTNEWNE
jgi:hypothetical protein